MSTYSNVDMVKTFEYHYHSAADSYLIQMFKWTLKSWELIAANAALFPDVFTTLAVFYTN